MLKKNVDCCATATQENEPRVTFTTRKFADVKDETPHVVIVREHIPLSAAVNYLMVFTNNI